jgi:hypothetical protein
MAQHVGEDRKGEAGTGAMRLTSLLMASGVNGPPRSVAKTKAESGFCRRSSRKARTSSPRMG